MRKVPRAALIGVTVLSLLGIGLTVIVTTAGATATLPIAVTEIVSPSGLNTDVGCPALLRTSYASVPVFSDLASAVAAAAANDTIYVCAGTYDLSASPYGSNEIVEINKSLAIDGYNWNAAPSPSDTATSVDPTTQSVFENGAGFFVQSPNVAINGLTFYENNFDSPAEPQCDMLACASSIDVMSLVSGPGDQGESNVSIGNNLFINTGAAGQNGVVHFGLGDDYSVSEPTTDVNTLDSGDVVKDNVFVYNSPNYASQAVQMSDTTGGLVTGNTVTYPTNDSSGSDDNGLSGLWFPGFDQGLVVSNNTLNGGGIDNDSGAAPDLPDPKSGIKVIDTDLNGPYGNGCSDQVITGNTISGFVNGISVISQDYDAGVGLCSVGPTQFWVLNNSVSNNRVYGIYVSADATDGTISGNVASDTDSEGLTTPSYSAGQYDYFDAAGNATTDTWTNDTGNGSSSPASIINEAPPTTTTTAAPPPPPLATTTTSTTTTSTTTTTTTTLPPNPTVTVTNAGLTSHRTVVTTLHCANATCSGTIELTKTVSKKIEIGHTKKYKVEPLVVVIGRASFSLTSGSRSRLMIQLNTTGLKLLQEANGHHFTCVLTSTVAGVTRHQTISI